MTKIGMMSVVWKTLWPDGMEQRDPALMAMIDAERAHDYVVDESLREYCRIGEDILDKAYRYLYMGPTFCLKNQRLSMVAAWWISSGGDMAPFTDLGKELVRENAPEENHD